MTTNALSGDELAEALLRAAAGVYTTEAAVRLLLAHDVWPARLLAADLIEVAEGGDERDEPYYYADVLWVETESADGGSG